MVTPEETKKMLKRAKEEGWTKQQMLEYQNKLGKWRIKEKTLAEILRYPNPFSGISYHEYCTIKILGFFKYWKKTFPNFPENEFHFVSFNPKHNILCVGHPSSVAIYEMKYKKDEFEKKIINSLNFIQKIRIVCTS